MSDALFALVADYGVAAVFILAFMSCVAVPVPTSLVMLAAGGFAAAGDLDLGQVMLAGFAGAVLGDQAGFAVGRLARARVEPILSRPASAPARAALERWGGPGVFLSRWLFSPLGPSVNLLAGAGGFPWAAFAAWGSAGEAVWVAIYVGLGFLFAGRVTELAALLGNSSGLVVALLALAAVTLTIVHRLHEPRARPAPSSGRRQSRTGGP